MKRILVVDDERQMTRTLCDILSMYGWETEARQRIRLAASNRR